MYLAGLLTIAFVALVIYLLVRNVDAIPQPVLRVLRYILIFGGSIELLFVFWVLGYVQSATGRCGISRSMISGSNNCPPSTSSRSGSTPGSGTTC